MRFTGKEFVVCFTHYCAIYWISASYHLKDKKGAFFLLKDLKPLSESPSSNQVLPFFTLNPSATQLMISLS